MVLTRKIVSMHIIAIALCCLCACSVSHKVITKRNLATDTRMSNTIFLDTTDLSQTNKVFLQVKNTSGLKSIALKRKLSALLKSKGIIVKKAVKDSDYKIEVNVIQAGKNIPKSAAKSLRSGYGTAIEGAWLAKNINSAAKSKNTESITKLIGASLNTTADALLEDSFYSLIADVQVSERLPEDIEADVKFTSVLKQGSGARKTVRYKTKTCWRPYQTRIVASANRINLTLPPAIDVLTTNVANSIAGILI